MATFEYSKFDGSDQFSPQSADKVFDELSKYLMHFGDEIMDNFERWEEDSPDVVDMLVRRGLVEKDRDGKYRVTPRGMKRIESRALENLFNVQSRDAMGRHDTDFRGPGQIVHEDSRPYEYGDPVSNLNLQETLKNAVLRQGGGTPVHITADDLVVHDMEYQTSCATVILLDMSGSMTRSGKYGAAKQTALALQALVRSRYQGDFLQTVGFYTYATPLTERELLNSAPKEVSIFDSLVRMRINLDKPPEFVPEHFTNLHAGLQFARRILLRQPAANKQIIVITDGEPTAHIEGRELVLLYPPSDKSARLTLNEARQCSELGIRISSFALVEDYFYHGLVNFVDQMAQVTGGISATCNSQDMGNMVVSSFVGGRRTLQRI